MKSELTNILWLTFALTLPIGCRTTDSAKATPKAPDLNFSFKNPPGPQFTEEQKQAQREAGKTVVSMVLEAYRRGADSVRIPPGDYRFGQEQRHEVGGRNSLTYALEFADLQRADGHPFTIDARGVTLWFDLGDDQTPTCHFAVGFKNCSNIIFKGAIIDRGTHGNIEGEITQIDFDLNRIEIQPVPGTTVPDQFSDSQEQRVIPFKADGRFCAPLYVLQAGEVNFKYKSITPGSVRGRYWVNMQTTALLDRINDPNWRKAYGELGVLRVGDGLSCCYTVSRAIELLYCRKLTMDGIHLYLRKGGIGEIGGYGGHLWKDCYIGPRPGTSQWHGGDGFLPKATRHGSTLDNVTILNTTDDAIDYHGYWGNIKSVAGNRMVLDPSPQFRETVLHDATAGDKILFYDKTNGRLLGNAVVTAIDGDTITLDKPVDGFANTQTVWPDHECGGWEIKNCHWHDLYQRLLITSGPGVVSNCLFERMGYCVQLNTDLPYVEGGLAHDITIANNVFIDINPKPHGTAIDVHSHASPTANELEFKNIVITGNRFVRSGIKLDRINGGIISGNRFENPLDYSALAEPQTPRQQQAIWLSHSTAVRVTDNVLSDPGHYTAPDAITGSPLLGIDQDCRTITLDGKPVGPTK